MEGPRNYSIECFQHQSASTYTKISFYKEDTTGGNPDESTNCEQSSSVEYQLPHDPQGVNQVVLPFRPFHGNNMAGSGVEVTQPATGSSRISPRMTPVVPSHIGTE